MNNDDFEFIRKFIKEQAGIVLDSGKEYLVEARLLPIAKEFELLSLEQLFHDIRYKLTNQLKLKVIDALTTNETLFFRDTNSFDVLKNRILPDLLSKKSSEKRLNIWCAAASSGQEPYTIAMILKDQNELLKGWSINFVASDISETILERAKNGIYNQFEINRGLPIHYLVKYFDKIGSNWQIKKEIRDMVNFKKINLMSSWSFSTMDIIFIRNVLIYFGVDTKKDIFKRLEKTLHPDGYFFLGGSETILGIESEFERISINKAPCYQFKRKTPTKDH